MTDIEYLLAIKQIVPTITLPQVQSALAKFNVQTIVETNRARITSSPWDRQTAINGISPSTILARQDIPTDPNAIIVLIYIDGVLSRIQPHQPYSVGFVPFLAPDVDLTNSNSALSKHLDNIAESLATPEIIQNIVSNL